MRKWGGGAKLLTTLAVATCPWFRTGTEVGTDGISTRSIILTRPRVAFVDICKSIKKRVSFVDL